MAGKSISKRKPAGKPSTPRVKAGLKSTRPDAGSKTTSADLKRQLKIQKALYAIADAASALKDMQSFYKQLHKIVWHPKTRGV